MYYHFRIFFDRMIFFPFSFFLTASLFKIDFLCVINHLCENFLHLPHQFSCRWPRCRARLCIFLSVYRTVVWNSCGVYMSSLHAAQTEKPYHCGAGSESCPSSGKLYNDSLRLQVRLLTFVLIYCIIVKLFVWSVLFLFSVMAHVGRHWQILVWPALQGDSFTMLQVGPSAYLTLQPFYVMLSGLKRFYKAEHTKICSNIK